MMPMEKNYNLIMLPFILFLVFSCSMESVRENLLIEGEHGFNFTESKSQWDELKKRNGNSYEYTLLEQSWTGVGSETTITVEKGKVVGRDFVAFVISEEDGTKEITDTYKEESKKEIGTHSLGAPPQSIDDLYKTCVSEYLIADPDSNTVYFDTNEEGIIALCGYVPVGCGDDCFKGIVISHFAWKN